MNTRRAILALIILNIISSSALAQVPAWIGNLEIVAYALGWLMMIIMGVKWILADSPNERADAKKGMMYIIIGLLVVRSAAQLIQLYCQTANAAMGMFVC
jgi:hypothetical protein